MAKQVHALVVRETGKAELCYIGSDLASIKAIIGGGFIEPFGPAVGDYGNWHGYCDEDGKYKKMPYNETATAVATRLGWTGEMFGDFLVGPVVFLGTAEDDPHAEGDLPNEATQRVIEIFGGFTEG